MTSKYAVDDLVREVMNAGRALSRAHYIYTENEAADQFGAVLHEMKWVFAAIPELLSITGEISFAVSVSGAPFQVIHAGGGRFVVLIDQRAFYNLLTFCLRIQTLEPIAGRFASQAVSSERDYSGKYLLDIAKDFAFHINDVAGLLSAASSRLIYQSALVSIMGHEIAHVSHGHLEFRASPSFSAFATTEDDRNLTFRTLEMDADSSGTTSVIDVFERLLDHHLTSGGQGDTKPPDQTRRHVREQYVVGMFIALLYMDALTSNYTPATYPIGYARFLTVSGVAEIALSRLDPGAATIPEEMRLLLVSVFERLSGSIGNLAHPIASNVVVFEQDSENPTYAYDAIGIAAGLSHLEPLYGRWAKLRPFLEQYQRGGRLAPAARPPI